MVTSFIGQSRIDTNEYGDFDGAIATVNFKEGKKRGSKTKRRNGRNGRGAREQLWTSGIPP